MNGTPSTSHPPPPSFLLFKVINEWVAQNRNRTVICIFQRRTHRVLYFPFVFCSLFSANLSEEYFRTRQDRGWHFREIHGLANFYSDLVRVVAGLSYRVTTDGRMEPVSQETDPVLSKLPYIC